MLCAHTRKMTKDVPCTSGDMLIRPHICRRVVVWPRPSSLPRPSFGQSTSTPSPRTILGCPPFPSILQCGSPLPTRPPTAGQDGGGATTDCRRRQSRRRPAGMERTSPVPTSCRYALCAGLALHSRFDAVYGFPDVGTHRRPALPG